MQDLARWLADLGLSKYEAALASHEVDFETLAHLTEKDLEDIGLPIGPRRKILVALKGGASAPKERQLSSAKDTQIELRPVTVVFADLAGFTALSQAVDAEELAQILQAYFCCVDAIAVQYGGLVERHIGDCIMAVFGVPAARGNDTERAVAAALAMSAAMSGLSAQTRRPLAIHIGVASGQVVSSRTGGQESPVFTVTGESVNLASRLADAAPAGQIYLSERVRRELGERLDGAEVGSLHIQGFERPMRTWRALGLHAAVSQHELVGRRIELAQLRAILDMCRENGRGHVIHLRGDAGIGKTRLLEEALAEARRRDFACQRAHVVDFGAGVGQDAIGVLVRGLSGLSRAAGETALSSGAAAVPEDAMFLMALAGIPHPPELRSAYTLLDERAREAGKRSALRRLIERASCGTALILAVEDLHWADAATLSALADIVALTTSCATILIATSRLELEGLDKLLRIGASGASLTTIDLGPLPPADVLKLAERLFSGGAEIVSRCVARANGNPFFLEQLFRHALEGEGDSVPATVESLVQARLDRLSQPDRAALQAASVLGQRFHEKALAAVLDVADVTADGLIAQGILLQTGSELAFAHALIREAVYGNLLRSRRTELHLKAASWFAGRDLSLAAAHLDRAGHPSAARAYADAARSSAEQFQYAAAKALIERGLELAHEAADRYALAIVSGDVHHALSLLPAALAAYEGALSAASSDVERARALIGRAGVKRIVDDLEGAFRDLEAAQAAAEASEATLERARIHYLRGNLHFTKGDGAGCIREHGWSLALAREAGAAEQEAAALGGLGDSEFMLGRMLSADVRFAECTELSAKRGFVAIEVAYRPMVAMTRWFAGDTRTAASSAAEGIGLARRIGHPRAEMIGHLVGCFTLHALGGYGAASGHAEEALKLARQMGARRFEAEALALQGKILLAMGKRQEALTLARAGSVLSRQQGLAFMGAFCLGMVAAATEDPLEVCAVLDEGDRLLADGAGTINQLVFRQDAIDLCLSRRDFDRALRYARELKAYTAAEPLPWSAFYVERAEVLVRIGQGERNGELRARLAKLQEDADRYGFLRDKPGVDAL